MTATTPTPRPSSPFSALIVEPAEPAVVEAPLLSSRDARRLELERRRAIGEPMLLVTQAHPQMLEHAHPNLGRLATPRHFPRIAATAGAGIPGEPAVDAPGSSSPPAAVLLELTRDEAELLAGIVDFGGVDNDNLSGYERSLAEAIADNLRHQLK